MHSGELHKAWAVKKKNKQLANCKCFIGKWSKLLISGQTVFMF